MKKITFLLIAFITINFSVSAQVSLPATCDFAGSTVPSGWVWSTLTPMYYSTGNPAPAGKFYASGVTLTVFLNDTPNSLSYDLAAHNGLTWNGDFRVEESADGITFTTVDTAYTLITTPTGIYTNHTTTLNSATRYVRFNMVTKVSGYNLALDNIVIGAGTSSSLYSASNLLCNSDSSGSVQVYSVQFGNGPYTYSLDSGAAYQSSNVFTGLAPGLYQLSIMDINNVISSPQYIFLSEPPAIYVSPISSATDCGLNMGSISAGWMFAVPPYQVITNYGDTINTSLDYATFQNIGAGQYSLTVIDSNGCMASSGLIYVDIYPINYFVPVCMVTVDSTSTHNIVEWEKTNLPLSVDSFRIYRETMTNVYTHIGSVSMDSLSEFHDYGANPNVTSYKYKLSAINTCGDSTIISDFHNTIHLQYLGLGNLQWSLYQIENAANPVVYYIINRDDTGTSNFLPISSTIPGGNNSYTDINYASYPNARYRVDVTWNISCNPTRTVTTTHSNVIHLGTSVSVSEAEQNNDVSISPNPFTNSTTITFANEQKNTSVKVMNVLGECIQQLTINNKQFTLDLSSFAKGIYFVRIEDENKNVVNRKIVKE